MNDLPAESQDGPLDPATKLAALPGLKVMMAEFAKAAEAALGGKERSAAAFLRTQSAVAEYAKAAEGVWGDKELSAAAFVRTQSAVAEYAKAVEGVWGEKGDKAAALMRTHSVVADYAKAVEAVWGEKADKAAALMRTQSVVADFARAYETVWGEKERDLARLLGPRNSVADIAKAAEALWGGQQRDPARRLGPDNSLAEVAKALDAVGGSWADAYDDFVERMDSPLSPTGEDALSSGVHADPVKGEPTVADDQEVAGAAQTADEFTTTLDAFIAVGLAGGSLVVNSTTLAWLFAIRHIERLRGRKAARQALLAFIALAFFWGSAAWLVDDADLAASEAVVTTFLGTAGVLGSLLGKVGGK